MAYKIEKFEEKDWPPLLLEIPDKPKNLYIAGEIPNYENKFLCVVGSRKHTSYGREACEYLIRGLSGYPVTIVSGLALGIDSIAHKTALACGLTTIAVPGSGLSASALHPKSHVQLAEDIVESGGTLISEMPPKDKATLWSFPQRNRIMAGMSHAILVIEAEIKSGTLITARLATDYNREVLAVPGNIFSTNTDGTNSLIKAGATPVKSAEDILNALNIKVSEEKKEKDYSACSKEEKMILEILNEPLPRDELIRRSNLPASEAQTILTLLEIKGFIKETLGEIRLD